MNRIALLVVAIVFTNHAEPSAAGRWKKFESYGKNESDKKTIYFSDEKIKTREGYVQFWLLEDYMSVQKKIDMNLLESLPPKDSYMTILSESLIGDKPSPYVKKYKSDLTLTYIDCLERRIAHTDSNGYRDNMGMGPIVYKEKSPREFSVVLPGSRGETIIETLCNEKR